MGDGELTLPTEPELQNYIAAILGDIYRSLSTAQINPNLPFGDLYPERLDWILQDIIDWIIKLSDRINEQLNYHIQQLTNYISSIRDWIYERATMAIQNWWYGIQPTIFWIRDTIYDIWNRVAAIATEMYHHVAQTINSAIYQITSYIGTAFTQLWNQLNAQLSQVWLWLSTHMSQLAQTIWGWIQTTWDHISTVVGDLWDRLAGWFSALWEKVVEVWGDIGGWFTTIWGKISDIPNLVLAGIADIGKHIWDTITDWLERDITDAIKEMGEAEDIEEVAKGSPFWASLAVWIARLLPLLWTALKNWLPRLALFGGIIALERTGKLEDLVEEYVTPAFINVMEYFESMGPMAPQPGGEIAIPLTKVLTVTITGLASFVLAGGVMGLFKQTGLGVVSAMIYDLVNFRTLTATFMSTLAAVYIAQPVKYYYQALARPYLPNLRNAMDLAGEYALVPQAKLGPGAVSVDALEGINEQNRREFLELTKFEGFSDEWGEKLYELADRPAGYFALRAMADAGCYNEDYFIYELLNCGYNVPTIRVMLDMFRRYGLGEVKSRFVTYAISLFKEGLLSEEQFTYELLTLGVPAQQIPHYIHGAQLLYQLDFLSDLLGAYKTQYSKGMIDEGTFRELLASIGLSDDRISAIVARENAKKFKPPKTKAAVEQIPEYLTDAGEIRVKTAREAFRRDIATAEELYAELVRLGMPLELADALVEFEIVRKAKPEE